MFHVADDPRKPSSIPPSPGPLAFGRADVESGRWSAEGSSWTTLQTKP
jgi:hypothetical protein